MERCASLLSQFLSDSECDAGLKYAIGTGRIVFSVIVQDGGMECRRAKSDDDHCDLHPVMHHQLHTARLVQEVQRRMCGSE